MSLHRLSCMTSTVNLAEDSMTTRPTDELTWTGSQEPKRGRRSRVYNNDAYCNVSLHF